MDDEPDFRQILAFTFKKKGYQVLEAENGREAFDLIQKQPVDVIISDILMPNGNGVELLDRTRQEHAHMPVILLVTGFSDLTSEEAHNKGAEALFSKPFSVKVLEEAIQKLLTPADERWARVADRVDLNLKVQISFQNLEKAVEGKVVSLGRGGMFVNLTEFPFPGVNESAAFELSFEGDGKPLRGTGTVRWVRTRNTDGFSSGCGIEFSYLGESERKQIIDLIQQFKPTAYIPNN